MAEKFRLSTGLKFDPLKQTVREDVLACLEICQGLVYDGVLHPTGEIICPDHPHDGLTLQKEELQTSPRETMKLRWLIAANLFNATRDDSQKASLDRIQTWVDADPFLSSQKEFMQSNALQTIDGMAADRENWDKLKTVRALVHGALCSVFDFALGSLVTRHSDLLISSALFWKLLWSMLP